MTDPAELRHQSALTEARSKISWGDPPVEAVKALMSHGYTYEEAAPLVADLVKERHTALRQRAFWKVLGGGALMAVPVLFWIATFLGARHLPIKGFAVTIAGAAYGFWLLINGLLTFMAPKSDHGDLADD